MGTHHTLSTQSKYHFHGEPESRRESVWMFVFYGNTVAKPILIEWIDSVVVAFYERPKNVKSKNQFSQFRPLIKQCVHACHAWTTTTTTELTGMTKRLLSPTNLMQFLWNEGATARRHCCAEWILCWLILAMAVWNVDKFDMKIFPIFSQWLWHALNDQTKQWMMWGHCICCLDGV